VQFENVDITNGTVSVRLKTGQASPHPSMSLRIYYPDPKKHECSTGDGQYTVFTEVPLQSEIHFAIPRKAD
jgi:hypothetical protein